MTESTVADLLDLLISKQEEIVGRSDKKLEEIKKHHFDCNIARTVGASVATAGAVVGIVGSALTMGASLAVGGIVAAAAGAATTIGTSIADVVISGDFVKDVEKMVSEQNEVAENLRGKLDRLQRLLIPTNSDLCSEVSTEHPATGSHTAEGSPSAISPMSSVGVATASCAAEAAGTAVHHAMMITGKGAGVASEQVVRSVAIGASSSAATVLTALSAVGAALDIGMTIYSWSTEHPTEEKIREIRGRLEKSIDTLKQLLDYYKTEEEHDILPTGNEQRDLS